MRAFVLHSAGDARVEDRPEPAAPGPGEVQLTVTRAGLCGTDLSEYTAGPMLTPLKDRHPATGVLGPVVLGHEFIGTIDSVGAGVDRLAVGDRVAAGAGVSCGQCDWCTRGQTNLCQSYWTYGLSADGGLTQRVTVPESILHPIASHVSDDNAALAQPLAVGMHAVDRSRVRPGDVVVVHGAGAIGSFVIAGLKAAGARTIIAVDIDENRLETAKALGADVTVDASRTDPLEVVREHTGSALADVTVEASGVPDGLTRVQRLTRRGGTILLIGLPKGEVSFNALDLILREIDVMTTLAHVCDTNLPAALALLAERDLAPLLVEGVVALDRVVEDALTPMMNGTARGKFLVDTQAAELMSEGPQLRVAFCGLGRMGAEMVAALAERGFPVTVWNRTPDKAVALAAATGAPAAESAASASEHADVVITMLTDGAAVLATLDGPVGVLAGARAGIVVVDCSTIGAEAARQAAALCARAGVGFLDSPVSGSTVVARQGKLGLMVGGDASVIDQARPVLDALGTVVHVGPTGAGAATKVAVNGLLHTFSTALSECMVAARTEGVSAEALFDVLEAGVLWNRFLDYKRPSFSDPDNSAVAFDLRTATKDLDLAVAASDHAGLTASVVGRTLELHQQALEDGYGDRDMAAMAAWFGLTAETNDDSALVGAPPAPGGQPERS